MPTMLQTLATLYAAEPIRHPGLRAVTLAQWMLESGRGTSRLAVEHLNFGGLKWRPEMATFATPVRFLAHDGEDDYCKFATLDSFVKGYWRFLQRSPYTGWEDRAADAEAFIRFIGPVYAPSNPAYADTVLRLVAEAEGLLLQAGATSDAFAPVDPALPTIVLDAGHGGRSFVGGSSPNKAISHSGVEEKKLTLDLALLLEEALRERAGGAVNVRLTRRDDQNVGIDARANMARDSGAALFLSLHFNGFNGRARGTECFFRDASGARRPEHRAFAQAVQAAALQGLASTGMATTDRGVKPDTQTRLRSLGVLDEAELGNGATGSLCRACLLELEFIDHPVVDEELVSGVAALDARRAVASQLAKGLLDHLAAVAP